jgi:hypothetical protein
VAAENYPSFDIHAAKSSQLIFVMKERHNTRSMPLICYVTVAVALIAITSGANAASHPTLFFTTSNPPWQRLEQKKPLGQELHSLLLLTSDWALRVEIPKEPKVQGPKVDLEGNYNLKGLVSSQDFQDAGMTIQSVMPVLGLSYHITGDRKFAARGIQWLNEYSQWKQFDVGKPDIQGAAALVGMVVGYDMFYKEMNSKERTKILEVIQRETRRFEKKAARLAKLHRQGNRALIANNHNIVPACAAGLGALLLKLEGADNGAMLQSVVNCFRQTILPSAFSPEGEYVDGTDGWLVYVMQSMAVFFEALRRNGGPNLWEEGNVRKVPEFMIRADSLNAEDSSYNYRWRYTLLAMASVYRDPELQGLALKKGFKVGADAKELGFRQRKAPEDAGSTKRWFSSAWEYLFYDPTLKPEPLKPRPCSTVFPNLGRAILRSSWKRDASVLRFRAGPRVGKDQGDNNAFQLTAFGSDLLPSLEVPFWPLNQRGAEWHKERDWFLGTRGNNAIIVDGMRQFSMLDPKFKGINLLKRPSSTWLSPSGEASAHCAEIRAFIFSPLVDYIQGEAGNAYLDGSGKKLLDGFSRHLFFVKDDYLIVLDDIKGFKGAVRDIEWVFHAGKNNDLTLMEKGFRIIPRQNKQAVSLEVQVVMPELAMKVERVPARDATYRSPYVSLRQTAKAAQPRALFVMDLKRAMKQKKIIKLLRNDDAVVVMSLGTDLIAWNKTAGTVKYGDLEFSGRLVWLRPEVAATLIEGTLLKWRGKSLINAKTPGSLTWSATPAQP